MRTLLEVKRLHPVGELLGKRRLHSHSDLPHSEFPGRNAMFADAFSKVTLDLTVPHSPPWVGETEAAFKQRIKAESELLTGCVT
jgi:hypothetical protein